MATVLEETADDSVILKYDAPPPSWRPNKQETESSMYVELRKGFLQSRCKEWK